MPTIDNTPHAVVAGDKILLEGEEFTVLRAVSGENLQLQNIRTGALRLDLSAVAYLELWRTGKAQKVRDAAHLSDTRRQRIERLSKKHPQDLKPQVAAELNRKLFYLRNLDLAGCDYTHRGLKDLLPQAAAKFEQHMRSTDPTWVEKPPHPRTIRKWRATKEAAGTHMALVPDHGNKGNRKRRLSPLVCALVDEGIRKRMLTTGGSSADVVGYVQLQLKRRFPDTPDPELPRVSRQTINRIFKQIPAWHRSIKKSGPRQTRVEFRGGAGQPKAEHPLDIVELDHTSPPVLVFCERLRRFLGRPTLALAIDVATRMILGFYLGFRPESDFTNMHCIRHAVMPKTYVKEMYPEIKGEWKAWGRWGVLNVDRGRQNFSSTTEAICNALDTEIRWCKPYTPWMKPHIETLNKLIQQSCIKNLRGNALRHLWEGDPAEAEKLPFITLSVLAEIVHKWIIDEYNQRPDEVLAQTPNDLWDAGVALNPPSLPDSAKSLNIIFGVMKTGQLSHRGIRYKYLTYNSVELGRIRQECGRTVPVTFKLDPDNLGSITVKHPTRDEYVVVPAVPYWQRYAKAVSDYQHDSIRAYAWNRFRTKRNCRDYLRAREEMHEIIDRHEFDKVGDRNRTARFERIGTESLFAGLQAKDEPEKERSIVATEVVGNLPPGSPVVESPGPLETEKLAPETHPASADSETWPPPQTAPQHLLAYPSKRRRAPKRARVADRVKTPHAATADTGQSVTGGEPDEFAPKPRGDRRPELSATLSTYKRS
jgi:putative transposase